MNQNLGTVISGQIIGQNEKAYFVQNSGLTYQLKKGQENYESGDTVWGFVYYNAGNKAVMTQDLPDSRQDHYGWGQVVKAQDRLGVFVDIGLPDKDIVVSLDELPKERTLWPRKGDYLFIRLEVDRKDRVWGRLAKDNVFADITSKIYGDERRWINQEKKARVYHVKRTGTYVITEDYHQGFIHPDERYEEPRLGQELEARVIGVGRNGNLNLSLKPRSFEALNEDAQFILALLKRSPNHFLPFNDKSDPQAIRTRFSLSKAQFKRALGRLMKRDLIIQTQDGIQLKDDKLGTD